MVTTAKITGVIKDDFLIEVVDMFGVTRYVQPIFAFPLTAIPYQDWVNEYKDKFLAVITFQDDGNSEDMQRGLMMGMVPLKNNQTPQEGLDGQIMLLAKNFRIWLNDTDNELVLDNLNNGKIKFGNTLADEPLMLGDTTKQWLNDFASKVKDLGNATSQITVTCPPSGGTSSPPINNVQLTQIVIDIQLLIQQLPQLLSQTVFTE